MNNYRGISLLPITYKIFSKAILRRLEEQVEKRLGEYQAGFRNGRCCPQQILNLKLLLNYKKLRAGCIVVTFVDFKKAYDSIDRTSPLNILEAIGVDEKLRSSIKETLTDTRSKIKFRNEVSE